MPLRFWFLLRCITEIHQHLSHCLETVLVCYLWKTLTLCRHGDNKINNGDVNDDSDDDKVDDDGDDDVMMLILMMMVMMMIYYTYHSKLFIIIIMVAP